MAAPDVPRLGDAHYRRLIPTDELEALVEVLVDREGDVTAAMVADSFTVPLDVAQLACSELAARRQPKAG